MFARGRMVRSIGMEYEEVELFRSELQYRLALALDLEDEEDERNRLFLKLSQGLAKTKEQIVKRIDGLLGSHSVIDEGFWEELEEILLMMRFSVPVTVGKSNRMWAPVSPSQWPTI